LNAVADDNDGGRNTADLERGSIAPQACACGDPEGGCNCSDNNDAFVYAMGVLKPVFPNEGIKQQFELAAQTLGISDRDYYRVFNPENPHQSDINMVNSAYWYIAEQLLWVLTIGTEESYRVIPATVAELEGCINALKKPENSIQQRFTTIIGWHGPLENSAAGLLPKMLCNHLFSFTMDDLHGKLNNLADAGVIQDMIKQLEFHPNKGLSDGSRAKNYLAYYYPYLYEKAQTMAQKEQFAAGYFIDSIETEPSEIISDRRLIDVIFSYKADTSDEKKYYYCSVDITGQYPFINTPLRPFILVIDRYKRMTDEG